MIAPVDPYFGAKGKCYSLIGLTGIRRSPKAVPGAGFGPAETSPGLSRRTSVRRQVVRAIGPDRSRVSMLWDPGPGPTHLQAVRSVAKLSNIKLQVLEVRDPDDLEKVLAALRRPPQAVNFLSSLIIYAQSVRLAGLTLKRCLPATSLVHHCAIAGSELVYCPQTWSVGRNVMQLSLPTSSSAPNLLKCRWGDPQKTSFW